MFSVELRKISLRLCILLITLTTAAAFIPGEVRANTLNVGSGQTYTKIQDAIDAAAQDGDEIIVHPGTYTERIDFKGKNIYLHSTNITDEAVVDSTIIDGRDVTEGSVVTFAGTETSSCVLAGMTITRGINYSGAAGIKGNQTDATIKYNNITGNNARSFSAGPGGGLHQCDGLIEYNRISNNSAGGGAGLYKCNGNIRYNTIFENYSVSNNGGALLQCNGTIEKNRIYRHASKYGTISDCDGTIQNNLIYNNTAIHGGGFAFCDGTMLNNTVYGNLTDINIGAGGGFSECKGTIKNCIIYNNYEPFKRELYDSSVPSYSCITNWTGSGTGNISVDPKITDISTGDLHLTYYSPCIDAGGTTSLNTDFEENARPYDGIGVSRGDGSDIDIGAYEFIGVGYIQPEKPSNISPASGEIKVGLTPTLQASAFVAGNAGGVHAASQWVILDNKYFPNTIFDSGEDAANKTSLAIASGVLQENKRYFWKVRYKDEIGATWSDWSDITQFSTILTNNTITVPGNYQTIQAAIDASFDGTEIVVSPGTYVENLQIKGKNIYLRSTDPTSSSVVDSTIIDGNNTKTVIIFEGTELSSCVIAGFTIKNGRGSVTVHGGSSTHGGGIYGYECKAEIRNNVITNNSADYSGAICSFAGKITGNKITGNTSDYGAGAFMDCSGIIENNKIYLNSANDGDPSGDGGAFDSCPGTIQYNEIYANSTKGSGGALHDCDGLIQNNKIYENIADDAGGAIYGCDGIIQNNLIYKNTGEYGAGVCYTQGSLINNTIYGNSSKGGGDLAGVGVNQCSNVINNIIWGNSGAYSVLQIQSAIPLYCCIQDYTGTTNGNINLDPRFADAANGNFKLQADSPCIDNGQAVSLVIDFEDTARPFNAKETSLNNISDYDMGAYEYTSTAINAPNRPVNTTPANNSINIDPAATLTASAFVDLDTGNTHKASEWIVDDSSDFSTPIFSSGTDATNKTSITLASGLLSGGIKYYWKVRYQDNEDIWSDWSVSTYFTTYSGNIIRVPANYSTIQAAIDAAAEGDTIEVAPGTYTENLEMNGKTVTLTSQNPSDDSIVASTIIDGGRKNSVIKFKGTELAECVIAGFTITNGFGYSGGGIYGKYTKASVKRNIIHSNEAGDITGKSSALYNYGGGIHQVSGIIEFNKIYNNKAPYGGGISSCDGIIQNNLIYNNTAEGDTASDGGGVRSCGGKLYNNVIAGNSASVSSGGMKDCWGTLENNIIYHNSAPANPQYSSCWFTDYNCVEGTGWLNSDYDPRFVDFENRDFHLRAYSPCIDRGKKLDLTKDFEGNTRPYIATTRPRGDGSHYDIGAYEYMGAAENIPERPSHAYPRREKTNESLTPKMRVYSFIDYDQGDYHIATQWQIATDSAFTNIIFDSGVDTVNKTTLQIASGVFQNRTRYYWRVRFSDNKNVWSEWSMPTFFTTLQSKIIYVPDDYTTIQGAIDHSVDGDTVIVRPNTYYENINFKGLNINLKSTDPTDENIVNTTIIDGSQNGSVVTFKGSENTSTTLTGFTITNGKAEKGGGIYANYADVAIRNNKIINNIACGSGYNKGTGAGVHSADNVIENCTISGNSAIMSPTNVVGEGGGLDNCGATIKNNTITGNSATNGGGFSGCSKVYNNVITNNTATKDGGAMIYTYPNIHNNIFMNNSAGERGGAMYQCGDSSYQVTKIWNNVFAYNTAPTGGAIMKSSNSYIQNNTFFGNSATAAGSALSGCTKEIKNCIIWTDDTAAVTLMDSCADPTYSCISGYSGTGTGNISTNPALVNTAGNNFSLSTTSPCIDAGALITGLTTDINGGMRPIIFHSSATGDGSFYDMGAYEFFNLTTTSLTDHILKRLIITGTYLNTADVNHDGKIDIADIVTINNMKNK